MERIPYSGTEIRLDGYWWENLPLSHVPSIGTYFFYKDGTLLHGRSIPISDLEQGEEGFSSQSFRDATQRSKGGWGIFQVNGKEITFEMWSESTELEVKTAVYSGKIIDEEIFVITSLLNNYSGETTARNDTFFFKPFHPKPDSTYRRVK
ncbi:MAG: hypothetical protein ACPGXL_09200 [Chitinophagales bacterium]